ncbi:MAG TPA: hypothetical protein DCS93_32100 [Microscillaceae bacterium]|nr:hypothetical protein [Microscillaceae bacterium]
MPTQANAEHDPQHQHDNLGQPQTVAPSLERLMGKETAQPQQTQAVPYGTPVAASEERILGKQAFQKNVVQKTGDELTMAQRQSTFTKASLGLSTAYTNFVDAANQVHAELKAKEGANAALTASLINIIMIWLPSGVSNILGGLANKLGKSQKSAVFKAAYHLLDKSDKIASTMLTIPKDQIVREVTVGSTGASSEKAILEGMKFGFHKTVYGLAEKIDDNIENREQLPDAHLLAFAAKWHPDMTQIGIFKAKLSEQIKMWQDTVVPIGEHETVKGSAIEPSRVTMVRKTGVVWVMQKNNTRALCLVQGTSKGQDASFRFLRFVSEDMKDLALAKSIDSPMHHSGTPILEPTDITYYPNAPLPKNVAKD